MKRHFIAVLCAMALVGTTHADEKKGERTAAEKQAIAKIRKMGGLALEVAQNDPHLVVSFLSIDGKIKDEHLALLKDLKGVVELNLRGREVTDAMLSHIAGQTELTRLHLEKTKISDKGLEHVKGLTNLVYLNLYGTAVSDKGLEQLTGLKKLKSLYLWQTKVTDAGVEKLKKALPKVTVVRGIEVSTPEKKDPPKKDGGKAPKKDGGKAPKKDGGKAPPKKDKGKK